MTKEQINGQKTGQSSASPFMKVNQQNPKRKSVSFNAIETIQKQGDSIDKLTSLMNESSSKLDRKDNSTQYKPKIHSGRNRGHGQRQNRYDSRDRSHSRDRGPYNCSRNGRNYQNRNNYVNRNYRPRNGDYQTNNTQNDRPNYRRENFNQNYGQRNRNRSAQVGNMRGLGQGIEVPREIIQQTGIELTKVQVEIEYIGQELLQEKEKRTDQGLDPVPMSVQIGYRSRCYRCNEYDHFAIENTLMIYLEEEQAANLQLLLPEEQTGVLNYSEESDLNL